MPRSAPFSQEIADAICERLRAGETVRAICDRGKPYPSKSNLYRWRRQRPDFRAALDAAERHRTAPRRIAHPRRGRPSYSPALAEQVLTRLRAGESQKVIGRDPAMPCVMTILAWSRDIPGFGEARRQAMAQANARFGRNRRPSPDQYNPQIDERVCDHLLDGLSVEAVGRLSGLPSAGTIHRWKRVHPQFAHHYCVARNMAWELAADAAIEARFGSLAAFLRRKDD